MEVALPVSADRARIPAGRKRGRMAKLVLRGVELVGVEARVVPQHAPRQSAVFVADAEEAAKGHDRIRDPSGELIDHDALNGAEFLSVAAANRGPFDFVARDQSGGFPSL